MGGLGSGRRPWRWAVDECRSLEIGELCDGDRRQSQSCGEVLWRARPDGTPLARLDYVITRQAGASQLSYRYWPEGGELCASEELLLEERPRRRSYGRCPTCGRRVRSLYAPRGARRWRCRVCLGLVYRGSQSSELLAFVAEVAGPIVHELKELPQRRRLRPRRNYVERPPARLAARLASELPLGGQELRFWCLRLRSVGLSYRQIAALTETSKSSVARICAAGRGGLDVLALVRERVERAAVLPALPLVDDPRAVEGYLRASHRQALRLGLYRHPISEREERVVMPADPDTEV